MGCCSMDWLERSGENRVGLAPLLFVPSLINAKALKSGKESYH